MMFKFSLQPRRHHRVAAAAAIAIVAMIRSIAHPNDAAVVVASVRLVRYSKVKQISLIRVEQPITCRALFRTTYLFSGPFPAAVSEQHQPQCGGFSSRNGWSYIHPGRSLKIFRELLL